MYKNPKNDDKYIWTNHAVEKMHYYRLSESLVKRIVRFPKRIEQAIAPNTIGAMITKGTKDKPREVWVMYRPSAEVATPRLRPSGFNKPLSLLTKGTCNFGSGTFNIGTGVFGTGKLKIISAWIYPGVTKPGDPIPVPEDLNEID